MLDAGHGASHMLDSRSTLPPAVPEDHLAVLSGADEGVTVDGRERQADHPPDVGDQDPLQRVLMIPLHLPEDNVHVLDLRLGLVEAVRQVCQHLQQEHAPVGGGEDDVASWGVRAQAGRNERVRHRELHLVQLAQRVRIEPEHARIACADHKEVVEGEQGGGDSGVICEVAWLACERPPGRIPGEGRELDVGARRVEVEKLELRRSLLAVDDVAEEELAVAVEDELVGVHPVLAPVPDGDSLVGDRGDGRHGLAVLGEGHAVQADGSHVGHVNCLLPVLHRANMYRRLLASLRIGVEVEAGMSDEHVRPEPLTGEMARRFTPRQICMETADDVAIHGQELAAAAVDQRAARVPQTCIDVEGKFRHLDSRRFQDFVLSSSSARQAGAGNQRGKASREAEVQSRDGVKSMREGGGEGRGGGTRNNQQRQQHCHPYCSPGAISTAGDR
eukprot:757218-Hanusia_phi.AAC.4